jgi:phosphoglycolate phosphatase
MRRLTELCAPDGLGEEEIDMMFEELKLYYTAHSNIKTKPYPGILQLLKYLKDEGYKTAIVSNKNHEAVLELTDIYFADYIDAAIGQRQGVRRKPNADCVFCALKRLNSERGKAVYIGDSEVDILTAQNADMSCVTVSWGFRDRRKLLEAGAEIIADDIGGIVSFLENSNLNAECETGQAF